mmetsp:Transcript_24442/g.61436  ORF Transcript_24442/g.61436 Transcript_24442/m.61436 type:complete len:418 (-) Transcript_24442:401-1654(-)
MMAVCPRNIKTPAGRKLLWIVPFSHCCSCTPHELLRHDHQHVLQDENPGRSTSSKTKNDLHLDRGAAEVEQFDAVLGPAGDATVAAKTPTPRRPPESRRQGKGAATPAAAASSVPVKSATSNATDHAGENYDLPAPASVVLVEELQRTSGQHSVLDQSKCSNENEDCCAHPNWGGEEQTCKEGYLPIPDPAPLTWCSSKRSDCATHRDNGIGCYGCYAPFRVKDQSRCSDQPDQSCCAHPSWGVPQTCSDGYEPVADPSPSTHCSSTSSSCASRDNGIGCYKCVTPFLGLMDQSKCNDNLGQDCCGHPSIGNQYQACDVGYLPVADPDPISWCSSKWSDCATATDVAHTPEIRCYGCYATTSSTTPAPEPTPAPGEGSSSFGIAALAIGGVLLLIGSIWLGKELTEKPEVPEDAVVT